MPIITTIKQRILQLEAGSFQILCDEYLQRIGYTGLMSLGTQAGTQKTTKGTPDSYLKTHDGKYVFVEYTTQQAGLEDKILSDIIKCFSIPGISEEDIAEIVYCHTSANLSVSTDKNLAQYCLERGVQLTLIGIDKLANDILRDYPILAKEHLGISVDTGQIQTISDFIKQYDANALAAPLATEFQFREAEIKKLLDAFENFDVVILSGAAGTGKTRLAVEVARQYSGLNNSKVLFIHSRGLPIFEDLYRYLETKGSYFVVVDDANQLTELELIVEYVNKRDDGFNVKILLTVRNYALKSVKEDLCGKVSFVEEKLTVLSDREISLLVKNTFGISNPHYLEQIVAISEGNARIAMFAGKTANESRVFDSIKNASNLYDEYFGKVFNQSLLGDSVQLQITAGILAFMSAINMDDVEFFADLLSVHGMSTSDFRNCAHKLHEMEMVDICRDKAVAISDQCFSNYILKLIFFDMKALSFSAMLDLCFEKHRKRTIDAVYTLLSIYQNHDVASFVTDEVKIVWEKRKNEAHDRYWNWVKVFYLFNQVETLLLVSEKIELTEKKYVPVDEIDLSTATNHLPAKNDIIEILCGYVNSENAEAALELLLSYYLKRPDLFVQFYHSINAYYGITLLSLENEFAPQKQLIDAFIQYSNNWENVYLRILFIELAKEFLKLSFSPCEQTRHGNGVAIYSFSLDSESNAKAYRSKIWEQLVMLLSKGDHKKALCDLIHNYACPLEDCSRSIVKDDAQYLCSIIRDNLSQESINDFVAVKHIAEVFGICDCPTDTFDAFFNSEKSLTYDLLHRPQWDLKVDFHEYENAFSERVIRALNETEDRILLFNKMLNIYQERSNEGNEKLRELSDGLMTAILYLLGEKENFIQVATMIIRSNIVYGLNIQSIVSKLFEHLVPSVVMDLVCLAPIDTKDYWHFAFYSEYPKESVDQTVLADMYDYLRKDYDTYLDSTGIRNLDFLLKYKKEDPNVFVNATRLILAKKETVPHIAHAYFVLLFNKYHLKPSELMDIYESDTRLLEDIYLFQCEVDCGNDYDGTFLIKLIVNRIGFAKEYIFERLTDTRSYLSNNDLRRLQMLFLVPNSFDLIDAIIDECEEASINLLGYEKLMKSLIVVEETYREKSDAWIKHFIKKHCRDNQKMIRLFEALSNLKPERKEDYFRLLIETNDDPILFAQIPICPRTVSWSGSIIPLYQERIIFLESIRKYMHGVRFLEHKQRINKTIDALKEKIKIAEIRELIER